ncbi:MAG: ABC transporter substrate-binding protein [Aggregatilineales bacterium]
MKKLGLLFVLVLMMGMMLGTSVTAQDDPIEITFAHIFDDDRQLVIQQIADAFMAENPGVVVTPIALSPVYDELFNQALLAADQGTAYSIVQVVEAFTQQAIDSGYFVPVSEVASEEQLATLDDVIPTIVNYYSLDDDIWSLPWNSSTPLLYYNKDIFTAAGLDPEAAPSTFAEITAACEAIMTMADELELSGCINWPMESWFADQWVAMQNGVLANNENGRDGRATAVTWGESSELLNVMEWWSSLAEAGYYTYSGTAGDYNGEGLAFLSRQTAITLNSTAGLALIQNFAAAQGFELGVAPLPLPDENATNGMTVGGASLWLSVDQSDEQLQAAADFAFFLTNTENDILWHVSTGYIPNRISSVEQLEADGYYEENPNFRIAVDQLANSEANAATAGAILGPGQELGEIIVAAFQSVVDGDEDPQAALQAAAELANLALADYNSFFE